MNSNSKAFDDLLAFLCGDFLSMVIVWVHLENHSFLTKVLCSAAVGFVGGIFGLAGKDIYVLAKDKISKWLK